IFACDGENASWMHDMYFLPVYLLLLDSIKNQGLASRATARALPYLAGRGLWPAGRGQAPPLLYDDPRFVLEPRYCIDCDDGWLAGQPQGPPPPLPTPLPPPIQHPHFFLQPPH